MKRIAALAMLCSLIFPSSNANAWFFFFLPGSVTGAISDAVTGSEGENCVGTNAKVGGTIRLPGGGVGTIKSLSGTSMRCTNPEFPIRALLDFSSNRTQTISPEVATPSPRVMTQGQLPPCPDSNAATWTNCVGTYTWPNAQKYVGEWKDGKRHGQGTYTTISLGGYVGEWKDDKPDGQGTYTFSNNEKHVGEWKDGKQHGQGTHTMRFGEYVGEFKDRKYHGHGTYTYTDGAWYAGEWKDGKRHGQGITFNPDGSIRASGIWQNDIFMRREGPISGSENAAVAPDVLSPSPTATDPSPPVSRPSPAVANPSPNSGSAAQRLRDLDVLFKDGVINENDFEIKKQEILKLM